MREMMSQMLLSWENRLHAMFIIAIIWPRRPIDIPDYRNTKSLITTFRALAAKK
jgi:hypothetical protein